MGGSRQREGTGGGRAIEGVAMIGDGVIGDHLCHLPGLSS